VDSVRAMILEMGSRRVTSVTKRPSGRSRSRQREKNSRLKRWVLPVVLAKLKSSTTTS
jgi:hypothetical protein